MMISRAASLFFLTLASANAVVSSETTEESTSRQLKTTYYPGKLTVHENNLLLSQGLTSRIIATSGSLVTYDDGRQSTEVAHIAPDYGSCFTDTRASNKGGWIYMSNSEARAPGSGGVGAFTFDKFGNLINYKRVLTNTTANCGGGVTTWGSYITCEETNNGRIYQVDPTGARPASIITMGLETNGGEFESFVSYSKDASAPQFFATEDDAFGVVRRWIPDSVNVADPWQTLTGTGSSSYLMVDPATKTYSWTTDVAAARTNANVNFPSTEGIDQYGDSLYFVTKRFKSMFILNLIDGTYTNVTTSTADFDGQPDQVINFLGKKEKYDGLLWFTEDGGVPSGLFIRDTGSIDETSTMVVENANPDFFGDETTGLSLSPDGKHLYFAMQSAGLTYDITRLDGRAFEGKTFNVKYHKVEKK